MRALLLLVFCFICISQGLEGVSAFEVDPHAIVANHVDTTSGAWREEENDLFVASRQSFILRRVYSSEWGKWKFFPHCSLIQGSSPSGSCVVCTFDSNGGLLRFVQDRKNVSFGFQNTETFCNTSQGPISYDTNCENYRCEVDKTHIRIILANTTVRIYEKISIADLGPLCEPFQSLHQNEKLENLSYFRLVSESFPTHECIRYSYDNQGRLASLEFVHDPKQETKCITFSYEHTVIHVFVDGHRMVSYSFSDGKLVCVNRTQKPWVRYSYQNTLLVKKEYPQDRCRKIIYDSNARVSAFFGSSEEPLYTFHYDNGFTEVRNINGLKICFHHQERLLQSIELFDENGLYRIDRFVWSEHKPVRRLLGQSTHTKDAVVLWATKNEYSADGNVTNCTYYSAETQHSENCIALNPNDLATGEPESQTLFFRYKPLSGIVLEQTDGSGNVVEHIYKDDSCLLSERFEKNQKEYKRRSFYKYDNFALVKEIHDNGCEKGENNLFGVSERRIFERQPRKYPKAGLDEEVLTQKCLHNNHELLMHRVRLLFDTNSNLVKKELYDTNGVLAKTEEFSYDDHGNCTRAVNALGEVILKSYDENDCCIRLEECSSGSITTFEYDHNGLPISTKTVFRDGSVAATASVYDLLGNKLASIDRYGNRTDYSYDAFSRLISITYPQVLDENGIAFCPQESFAYDIFNNLVVKTDPKGYSERYFYTSSGKVLRIDFPDGSNEIYEYTGDKIQAVTNRDLSQSRYRYDKSQRLVAVETFARDSDKVHCIFQQKFSYSSRNLCEGAQGSTGGLLSRKYDPYGRVILEIESTSFVLGLEDQYAFKTEYEYDSLHRPHRVKRWIDNKSFIVECRRYDSLDREVSRWVEESDNTKSSHVTVAYDFFGNVAETISSKSKEKIEYVETTRPYRITDPDGAVTQIEYKENDSLGQRFLEKVIIDPAGMSTSVIYDALGRVVQQTLQDPTGNLKTKRSLFYDACNNLCRVLEFKNETDQICTEWKYGPCNRLESVTEGVGSDSLRKTSYAYDTIGKLSRISYSDGTFFTYEYGKDGTLTKLINAKSEVVSTFFYNASGLLVSGESSKKVKIRRSYTPQGRIADEKIEDEWGSYGCEYSYDRLGRVKAVYLPSHAIINYTYMGTRQKGVSYKSARSNKPDYLHEYTQWDGSGRPTDEILITGDPKSRSYSDGGALISLRTPYRSDAVVKRDQVGNVLAIETGEALHEYCYNSQNQLTEERQGERKENYAYDLLGNLVQHNNDTFFSNALNQLSGDKIPCRYDSKGNLTEKGQFSFTYNDCNQLIEATDTTSGASARYRWDVHGRRVSRTSGSSVHRYFYIGNTEIGALDEYGFIEQIKVPERVVDNNAIGAVCIEIQKKCYLPITDLFGNIVELVNPASKQVVESYEHTAYGQETIVQNAKIHNPWRYRGLRTDPLTKLVQFTFRDYSPEMQHFLTTDPLGYTDGPNLYGYARSNPLSYCDIDGLATRRGACLCHGLDCEYYKGGVCGHGAGVLIEDEPPSSGQVKVIQYEQSIAREREHRNCKWPVQYSRSFDFQRESVPGRGIGFINGVANTFLEACFSALYISDIAGEKNVHLTYAASNGLIRDVRQAAHNLYGFHATNATQLLHDSWVQYFDSEGSSARYLQVCHSWGAIHVRNALLMSDREMRNRIDVVAVAPAAYISRKICKDVVHYINDDALRDGIPRIDRKGLKMALRENTVRKVRSDPSADYMDHAFQSLTYKRSIKDGIEDYLGKQEN